VQYVLPGFGDLKVSRRAMQTWPFSSLSVRGIWQARGFPALPFCEFYRAARLVLYRKSQFNLYGESFALGYVILSNISLNYLIFIPSYCSKPYFPLFRVSLPLSLIRPLDWCKGSSSTSRETISFSDFCSSKIAASGQDPLQDSLWSFVGVAMVICKSRNSLLLQCPQSSTRMAMVLYQTEVLCQSVYSPLPERLGARVVTFLYQNCLGSQPNSNVFCQNGHGHLLPNLTESHLT
jgi:hypothetical protein